MAELASEPWSMSCQTACCVRPTHSTTQPGCLQGLERPPQKGWKQENEAGRVKSLARVWEDIGNWQQNWRQRADWGRHTTLGSLLPEVNEWTDGKAQLKSEERSAWAGGKVVCSRLSEMASELTTPQEPLLHGFGALSEDHLRAFACAVCPAWNNPSLSQLRWYLSSVFGQRFSPLNFLSLSCCPPV